MQREFPHERAAKTRARSGSRKDVKQTLENFTSALVEVGKPFVFSSIVIALVLLVASAVEHIHLTMSYW